MSVTAAIATLATKLSVVADTRIGRAAIETTSAELPVITIWSTRDSLAAEQDYDYPAYTRSIVIEYKSDASADDYHLEIDSSLAAIRAALQPDADGGWIGGDALMLREQAASIYHPQPGAAVFMIQIPIEVDYA